MQFLSVYLHIPFCRVRCSYCAFNIYTDQFALVDAYIEALCTEIRCLGRGETVHTIYLGGGTPSLLTLAQLNRVLTTLSGAVDLQPECEITIEVNPGTVDRAYLEGLRTLGVNRLSLGMQSAKPGELTLYKRDHTFEETQATMQVAQRAGFDNISLDLIYGTPGQSLMDWQESLEAALALKPQHFSLYGMQLESGTQLTKAVKSGKLPIPDDDLAADMYDAATDALAAAGFVQYEISSWGQPGKASKHNLQYWRNLPYLGLGAGAHGSAGGLRTVNTMRPERYIERLQGQTHPLPYPRTGATQSFEVIERDEEMFETIILGLRLLQEGLSGKNYLQRYGESIEARYGAEIEKLKTSGLLLEQDGVFTLAHHARLIANRVFEVFVPEPS
jgi:oxygen-independent coproporphyrinogen III oxidase